MIHFLTGSELADQPVLKSSMMRDRKRQFIDRLGWRLQTTSGKFEIDEYDQPDSMYIICSDDAGKHKGSMRLIPTNRKNMTHDHFGHLFPGISFNTDQVWECTRFCVSPVSKPKTAATLLAGAARVMNEYGLRAFLAVFNAQMHRVFRRLGTPPLILGSEYVPDGVHKVGLWQFDRDVYANLVFHSLYDETAYSNISIACSAATKSNLGKPGTNRLVFGFK